MVVTMSHATRLAILAAALTLAASAAQAFTMTNQGTTGTSGAQGGSSYGNTLTDPGSAIRNYGGADLSTPNTSTPATKPEGFSFQFGTGGPFGSNRSQRLAPPAWSMDPLYLERDH